MKLTVMRQLGNHPLLQPDAGLDTQAYVHLAQRVLGGDVWLGPGLYYLSPLYLYFLSAALGTTGSFTAVRAIQVILGTGAVYATFATAREWFGVRAGWIAAVLAALTGVLTFYEIVLLQSALDPFLTAWALWCLTLAVTRRSARAAVAAGLLLGLQTLNRPNVLIAALVVGAALIIARRHRVAGLLAAGLCVAIAPVVIRNAVVSRQFTIVSSQGGLNFYIGNHQDATGQYTELPGIRADIEGQSEDTRRLAEASVGHPMTDSEVSSYYTRLALSWIRTHPESAARLFGRKLALTFSATHQWLDFSYPYYQYDTGSVLRLLIVGPWLLVPLGLAGLVAGLQRRRDFLAFALFVPAYAAAVALFFVGERYRLPLLVPLCVGAGAAIDAVLAAAAAGKIRLRALPSGILALAAVLAFWPHGLDDGRYAERLRLSKVLMNRGDFSTAANELQAAHRLRPSDTVAEFNLGIALAGDGRPAESIPYLRQAVASGVPIAGARYALANALLRSGDADEARRLLRSFQPQATDSAESCVQVAYVAMNAGALDVAERFLLRATDLRPEWDVPRSLLTQLRHGGAP